MSKLWLDDVRKPPDESWTWCKSVDEALVFVKANACEEWALDHDLGGQLAHYGHGPYDFEAPSGLAFVSRLATECDWSRRLPSRISIHSTNDEGVYAMIRILYRFSYQNHQDIEIIVRPMRGRIMDRTPYYEESPR